MKDILFAALISAVVTGTLSTALFQEAQNQASQTVIKKTVENSRP